jgi:very-short-patch-repair endonuclease
MADRTPHANQVLNEIARELDSHQRGGSATLALRAVAEKQHGVVANRQLSGLGLGNGLIRSRIENGSLIPIHQGVFALGHGMISRRARWMAAVIACGPGAVLSHSSAAELWEIRRAGPTSEVTRRSGGSPRAGIRLHQTRMLDDIEVVEKDGIPTTSIERALLDMAARLDDRQTERILVAADRTGALRWSELNRLVERTPRRPGAGRLRRVALQVDPRAVDAISPLEVDFLALCRRAGLQLPQVNVMVEGHLVDFLWPTERVVVETDGYAFHADRPAFELDHTRTAELETNGYRVHRATYRMLTCDPAPFLDLVRASLDRLRHTDGRESSSPSISSRT